MANQELAMKKFLDGYRLILEGIGDLGYDVADDNFKDTAKRAAKALGELTIGAPAMSGEIEALMGKTFPAKYAQMVISKHNVAFGLCPHHLLPVIYRISVAYLPREKVLGISKLSRLVSLMARRPVLQEDLTEELAEILHESLESAGAAAYVEGLHLCMASRGINAHEARVVTSAVRGVFLENALTRTEFLNLVTATPMTLL